MIRQKHTGILFEWTKLHVCLPDGTTIERKYLMSLMCFVHPDRPATDTLNIPCFQPDGNMPVCAECKKPEAIKAVWEKYQASHSENIVRMKGEGAA